MGERVKRGSVAVVAKDRACTGIKVVPLGSYADESDKYFLVKDKDLASFLEYHDVVCVDAIAVWHKTCIYVFDDSEGVCSGLLERFAMDTEKIRLGRYRQAQKHVRDLTRLAIEKSPFAERISG